MKRVLSIDGGGIRGVVPACVLSWLEVKLSRPSAHTWDLIAGTSTGGILAAGLAHTTDGHTPTYSAESLLGLYVNQGATIFHREWYDELALLKVRYSATGIESVLQKYYGEAPLSSALVPILVTAFDQSLWQPRLFKSRKAKLDPAEDAKLWEVSRATSAAPTYFPNYHNLLDGGVIGATNPAMLSLTEASIMWPGEEVFLLSLGTGRKDSSIASAPSTSWGELAYLKSLVDMLLDGPERTVERSVSEILPPTHYVRIQGLLTVGGPSPHMDDASDHNIHALIDFANKVIEDNRTALDWVVRVCGAAGAA